MGRLHFGVVAGFGVGLRGSRLSGLLLDGLFAAVWCCGLV